MAVGVKVWVTVGVAVGVFVGVKVDVGVDVGVSVGVKVNVGGTRVSVIPGAGVRLNKRRKKGILVGVDVLMRMGVAVARS